jgi:CDP-diacylglycerol--glycerol-3-phosphate 3-phosphatidyltransferase
MTVPNLICFARMAGSGLLLLLAVLSWRYGFVALFTALSLSDWVDGKLARRLQQRSDLGARIDSLADSMLYAALLGGALILSPGMIQRESSWLVGAIGSYGITTAAGLWKFGKVPSYHTYGAKTCQWFALAAGICVILEWSAWPLRITSVIAVLTNLEATAITFALRRWQADVPTLFHVWPTAKQARVDESSRGSLK